MKKQKTKKHYKHYLIPALVLFLVAVIGVTLLLKLSVTPTEHIRKPDTVRFVSFFMDEHQQRVLDSEIWLFTDTFPEWKVEHITIHYRSIVSQLQDNEPVGDVITIMNPAAFSPDFFHDGPAPWSGEMWGLYYNPAVLSSLLEEEPIQPDSLEALTDMFRRIAEKGTLPLAIGASHGWPLTALVQHVAGELGHRLPGSDDKYGGPETGKPGWAALAMATGELTPEDQPVRAAIETLLEWKKKGWINPDGAALSWPFGPRAVLNGEAGFTLLNQQFITAVPPAWEGEIGFFHFPGEWVVGSVIFLARPGSAEDRPAVREFKQFLTSPGVVDRLERSMGRPFFGGTRSQELPEILIPSITADPNSAFHRNLWRKTAQALW